MAHLNFVYASTHSCQEVTQLNQQHVLFAAKTIAECRSSRTRTLVNAPEKVVRGTSMENGAL